MSDAVVASGSAPNWHWAECHNHPDFSYVVQGWRMQDYCAQKEAVFSLFFFFYVSWILKICLKTDKLTI